MNIGKKIKEILDERGMKITEFSRRLNTSNQNAHAIFKRTSIDTEQLERIGEILDHDFFQYYVKTVPQAQGKKKTARLLIEVELDDDVVLKKALQDKISKMFR